MRSIGSQATRCLSYKNSENFVEEIVISIDDHQIQCLVSIPKKLTVVPARSTTRSRSINCRRRQMKHETSGIAGWPSIQFFDDPLKLVDVRRREADQALKISTPRMPTTFPFLHAIVSRQVLSVEVAPGYNSTRNFEREYGVRDVSSIITTRFKSMWRVVYQPILIDIARL